MESGQWSVNDYLIEIGQGGVCVAFSGGADSALVLAAAKDAGLAVHAVTVKTPLSPPEESDSAKALAEKLGVVFALIEVPALPEEVLANTRERCYLCKKLIFTEIMKYAAKNGLEAVLDGTNADDLTVYRPGLRALRELGVKSPLSELGLTKAQVRHLAGERGLPVAQKPAAPCLATRIPYDTRLDFDVLANIHALESGIKAETGIAVLRARLHGRLVRLEVLPSDFAVLLENRQMIAHKAKQLGFERLTLDLEGFRSGSFDNPQ